jgi:UrcA family protein
MNRVSFGRRRLLGLAVSGFAALNAAAAVAAAGYSPGSSITVKYSRAELERRDGVESVYRRIRTAARMVCEDVDVHDLQSRLQYEACYKRAVAVAVENVGDACLAALHRSDTARRATMLLAAEVHGACTRSAAK